MQGSVLATPRMRQTKLVCTLGPAVEGRVAELVGAGMDVARLNFSHGAAREREAHAAAVTEAASRAGRVVALLADLSGPKIRIGALEEGTAELEAGAPLVLAAGPGALEGHGSANHVGVTYARLPDDVRAGDTVLLGDGAAELRVESIDGTDVTTVVVRGGTIRSRTGVAIPSDRLSMDALTDKDRADAAEAVGLGCHLVAQSFVRTADDVAELRNVLGPDGPPIVAKIETRPAIDRFDAILDIADGVMIARGDLGVELPYEEVPIIQKQLVRRALERGIPTIVATQMLESMISSPRPTRAEASDVANAVFDGADAIMLSAETAIGEYPILAAEAAVRIIRLCEARGSAYLPRPDRAASAPSPASRSSPAAASSSEGVVIAAVALADADPCVDVIACFTRTGRTARMLAALRPRVPVIAFSPDPVVVSRLALVHGVTAVGVEDGAGEAPALGPGRLGFTADRLTQCGLVAPGSTAVIVAASGAPGSGPTLVELRHLPE